MTIVTKNQEKATEKAVLPLVGTNINHALFPATAPPTTSVSGSDVDSESMIYYRRRISASATIFLFLTALSVMLMGILGGITIYRLYIPSQSRMHFQGMCDVPYASQSLLQGVDSMSLNDLLPRFGINLTSTDMQFFREEYEIDLSDNESYAKINVPDFLDGRGGRYMHDFKENQSAIIDENDFRCFVLPLDRETVLPPKSFYDIMEKMRNGYYDIDTDRIRQNWRVVTPELTDTTGISSKIANECIGMKIYLLEKYVSGVSKRSIRSISSAGKFAEFAGKNIVELNLINIDEIEKLENN